MDERFTQGYQDDIGEVEEPEQEGETASATELQSGRGDAIKALRYAVPINIVDNLTMRSLDTFRPLSEGWHRFLRLSSIGPQAEAAVAALNAPTPAITSPYTSRPKRAVRDL